MRFLARALDYLESRRNVSKERLREDYELRSAVERNFQIAIEAAIDIGEMIIAEEGAEPPETNREVFLRLGELGVLPREFAENLALMAGFRNLLVHQYGSIDMRKLKEFLNTKLDDLREFERYVRAYLRRKVKDLSMDGSVN